MPAQMIDFLETENISKELLAKAEEFCRLHSDSAETLAEPHFLYYGKEIWEQAICGILSGQNILLAGPKATGKNVLAENLAYLFGRPYHNISFHINVDAASMIGTDTFDGERVVFRPGPIYACARDGGFGILDEINMAKNEAMAVLHATLDHRRIIEVPGYDMIRLHPATRFIATMNYGYAGTRELNEALGSRFIVIQMPVISEKQLTRLLTREYPDIRPAMSKQLCAIFYELNEKAENGEISPRAVDLRGLLDAASLMANGLAPLTAMDLGITNKIFDSVERAMIHDVMAARIPRSWN